jgi:hypothetical protein
MSAGRYNIALEQGTTFQLSFTWRAPATPQARAADPKAVGPPIDLTGYTAKMQVRQKLSSVTPEHEFTTENGGIVLGGELGTVTIQATAEETASWSWGSADTSQRMVGIYDLELVNSDGEVRRLLEGSFTVKREVTRDV